jgi:hypothetical protein
MSLVVEPPDWAVILSVEEKHLMEYQGLEYSVVQFILTARRGLILTLCF